MDKPFVIVICVIMASREKKKSHDTEIMGKIENNSLHKWITKLESAKYLWGETITYLNYKKVLSEKFDI